MKSNKSEVAQASGTNVSAAHKNGLKVFHKGLILVFAPLVIEIVIIASLALVLMQLDSESVKESRYRRCAAIGAKLIVLGDSAAIDIIAWFQSGRPEMLRNFDRAISDMHQEEKKLELMAKNDPITSQSARDLVKTLNHLMGILENIASLAKQRMIIELAAVIPQADKEFHASRSTDIAHIGAITSTQEKIAAETSARQRKLDAKQQVILRFALLANAIAAVVLSFFFKCSISDRLKTVKENTARLSENRALEERLSGADEIAQLDSAFHKMDQELKAAAERERALFENASDVICVLNKDNEFQRINPACKKHWSFEPEEIIFKQALDLVNPAEREKAQQAFQSAHKGAAALFELRLKTSDENLIDTLWSSYWSEEEKLLYCVVHDISERKSIERIKQSYLTMISSDLKIPLSAIALAAEKLSGPLRSSLSERALDRVEMVKTNLGRLLALVNDLLQMAELESGKLTLIKQECQIKELLERSAQDLEGLAQKKQVKFEILCNDEQCSVDPNRIIQVIVNLASNAIKFSPEAGLVTLSAEITDDFLFVKVADQGRGVPETHKKTIFEKFKQVEASDGKRAAGTGLGLPICKEIIEEHGGQIGVESETGKGSLFWFKIPVKQEQQEKLADICAADKTGEATTKVQTARSNFVPDQAPVIQGRSKSLLSKGLFLIGIPLLFEFLVVILILSVISQTNESRSEELRQRQIASDAYTILDSYFKMILTVSASANEPGWLIYDRSYQRMKKARSGIGHALKNDPSGMRQFLQSEKFNSRLDLPMEQAHKRLQKEGYSDKFFDEVHAERIELIALTSAVAKRLLALIEEAEKKEAVNPVRQAALRQQQGMILSAGLAINIVLSLLLARFFSRNITTRLATLADNTSRFSREQPLNSLLPGNDEIAELDRIFRSEAAKLDEARRKERAVFANSQDLIAALDPQLRFISSNPAVEHLLGYKQEELKEKNILDLIPAPEKERMAKLLKEANLFEGKSIESMALREDGKPIYLLWSLSRPSNEDNIYCIAHDISDRKELERLKQEFLAVVSHDLRNPLGSVIGFITLIKAGAMGPVGEESQNYLKQIIQEADTLLSLINDLLDLEKLEAQGMELELKKESVGKIAYNAFEALAEKFPGAQLSLPESNDLLELDCDPERLAQAFSNIFSQILHRAQLMPASAENQSEIIKPIELRINESNKTLKCRVTDPGPAYSKLEQEQLFERFKFSHDKVESSLQGSGLALPLAKRIIEAHHGNLCFNPEFSAFEITIKLEAQEDISQ